MFLNQNAVIFSSVRVNASAVVFARRGPTISATTADARRRSRDAARAALSASHTSDSGICRRMNMTIIAGSAESTNAARHPIHGATKLPVSVANIAVGRLTALTALIEFSRTACSAVVVWLFHFPDRYLLQRT